MVFHVYDCVYCKKLTIIVCDMQYEDIEVQQLMWKKLNEMMLKHGGRNPDLGSRPMQRLAKVRAKNEA
jgi:hypothetical protein